MSNSIPVRKGVFDTPIYEPGLPVERVARDYGISPDSIIKLASNENPLGPSPKAVEAIQRELVTLNRYPDGGAWNLTHRISEKIGVPTNRIITGNGSNEILELLGQVFLEPGTNAVMGEFPFIVYPLVTRHFGAKIRSVPMPGLKYDLDAMLDAIDEHTRLIFIASPNNPTPYDIPVDEILSFINRLPDHVVVCFDEAYAEYLDEQVNWIPLIDAGKNVVVTRTFSKIYGLAGLRVGYAYGPEWIISLLLRTRQPFSVNSLALVGALAALDDDEFVALSKNNNNEGLQQLSEGLKKLGLKAEIAKSNFILVHVPNPTVLCEDLLKRGIIVRSVESFSLDGMVRVSVGCASENERFLHTISELLSGNTAL